MKSNLSVIVFIFAVSTYASVNSIQCGGVVYNGKTEISTSQPDVFKRYGLVADLYLSVTVPPVKNPVYMDLQKIAENETPNTIETTYVWCPKSTPTNPSCFKAVRVLKINKQTGAAQFFNQLEDKTNLLVSTTLSCEVQ